MLKVENGNIKLTRGDTGPLTVKMEQDGAEVEVGPNDQLTLTIKRSTTSADALVEKTVTGTNDIVIDPADTEGLAYGSYKYDVELTTENGGVFTVVGPATFRIGEEVTW